MPNTPSDDPVVVTTATSEPMAAILIAQLQGEGIEAQMAGEYTSGFRAEAPGGVQILVHASDAERAREILEQAPPVNDA